MPILREKGLFVAEAGHSVVLMCFLWSHMKFLLLEFGNELMDNVGGYILALSYVWV